MPKGAPSKAVFALFVRQHRWIIQNWVSGSLQEFRVTGAGEDEIDGVIMIGYNQERYNRGGGVVVSEDRVFGLTQVWGW